jgi:hypothetical protein
MILYNLYQAAFKAQNGFDYTEGILRLQAQLLLWFWPAEFEFIDCLLIFAYLCWFCLSICWFDGSQASTLFEYPKLVVWKHVDKEREGEHGINMDKHE